MANVHRLYPIASFFAPLVNRMSRGRLSRRLLHLLAGIDRRRSLPEFHRDHFRRWVARHRPVSPRAFASAGAALAKARGEAGSRKVVLLDDCFTTFNEPNVGCAAVRVLEAAGCRVELGGICCGRALISKGYLPQARELARRALPELARRVADGT